MAEESSASSLETEGAARGVEQGQAARAPGAQPRRRAGNGARQSRAHHRSQRAGRAEGARHLRGVGPVKIIAVDGIIVELAQAETDSGSMVRVKIKGKTRRVNLMLLPVEAAPLKLGQKAQVYIEV